MSSIPKQKLWRFQHNLKIRCSKCDCFFHKENLIKRYLFILLFQFPIFKNTNKCLIIKSQPVKSSSPSSRSMFQSLTVADCVGRIPEIIPKLCNEGPGLKNKIIKLIVKTITYAICISFPLLSISSSTNSRNSPRI